MKTDKVTNVIKASEIFNAFVFEVHAESCKIEERLIEVIQEKYLVAKL